MWHLRARCRNREAAMRPSGRKSVFDVPKYPRQDIRWSTPPASLGPRPQGRDLNEVASGRSPWGRRKAHSVSAEFVGPVPETRSSRQRHEQERAARNPSSDWPSGHLSKASGFARKIRRHPPSPADNADSPHLPGAASVALPGRPAHVDTHRRQGRVSSPAGASAPGTLRRAARERRPNASAVGRAPVEPLHGRTARPSETRRRRFPVSVDVPRCPSVTTGGHRELRSRHGDLLPTKRTPASEDSSSGVGGACQTQGLRLPGVGPAQVQFGSLRRPQAEPAVQVWSGMLRFGAEALPGRSRQQVSINTTLRKREIAGKSCRYASPRKDRAAPDGNIGNGNEFDSGARPCGPLEAPPRPLVETRTAGLDIRQAGRQWPR
jgi:hypothetical protein